MSSEQTDAERMTKFETQMENVLAIVTKMDTKIDAWQANFVSKEMLDEKLKARDKEIDRLGTEQQRLDEEKAQKKDIERLEKEKTSFKSSLPMWIAVVISAINLGIIIFHK